MQKIIIKFKSKGIIVYFKNNIFLKQLYIRNLSKNHTFFLVLLILNRYGLIKSLDYKNVYV
jgi:hypothetical protein